MQYSAISANPLRSLRFKIFSVSRRKCEPLSALRKAAVLAEENLDRPGNGL